VESDKARIQRLEKEIVELHRLVSQKQEVIESWQVLAKSVIRLIAREIA
jgi:Mg2+ and Co2+ transporter CorA